MKKSLFLALAYALASTAIAAGPPTPERNVQVSETCTAIVGTAAKSPFAKSFMKDLRTAQKVFGYCVHAGHVIVSATLQPKNLRRPHRNTAESGTFM